MAHQLFIVQWLGVCSVTFSAFLYFFTEIPRKSQNYIDDYVHHHAALREIVCLAKLSKEQIVKLIPKILQGGHTRTSQYIVTYTVNTMDFVN